MDDSINGHKQVRLSVKKEVLINNAVKGHALDISEGGMFIYTHVQIPKGRLIELNFTLDEGCSPIKTQACVQFVLGGVGIRVEFTNLSQANIEHLKKFIEKITGAYPLGAEAATIDKRKKVLLVDDSASARNTYKNKLVLTGYNVQEASSGIEAIKLLAKEIPDLMVLDLQMEGMDGLKVLQLLRSNEKWKEIKVIVLSGRVTTEMAEKISEFGISGLLPKMTTTPNKLADCVKQILGGS